LPEAKHLSGAGVAKQRKAIVIGIKTSIVDFTDANDTLHLLLLTHYFDCITELDALPWLLSQRWLIIGLYLSVTLDFYEDKYLIHDNQTTNTLNSCSFFLGNLPL
jgi:hypothetical protein